ARMRVGIVNKRVYRGVDVVFALQRDCGEQSNDNVRFVPFVFLKPCKSMLEEIVIQSSIICQMRRSQKRGLSAELARDRRILLTVGGNQKAAHHRGSFSRLQYPADKRLAG